MARPVRCVRYRLTQNDGDVLIERGRLEMIIHPVGPGQQVDEVVEPNVQGNRHPNGGPQGVAPLTLFIYHAHCTVR